MKNESIPPIPERVALPSMLTLYNRDLASLEDMFLRRCLEIPVKIACSWVRRYPVFRSYLMDFIQEGNIRIYHALEQRDPEWSDERLFAYLGAHAKGAIRSYLTYTRDIFIPHSTRSLWDRTGKHDSLFLLEQHLSWERIFTREHIITSMQHSFSDANHQKIEHLLSGLTPHQQGVIRHRYELEGAHEMGHPPHSHYVTQALDRMRNKQKKEDARKERIIVPRQRICVTLHICEKGSKHADHSRLNWAIRQLQQQGCAHPTDQQVKRFFHEWCMNRIDEAIAQEENT